MASGKFGFAAGLLGLPAQVAKHMPRAYDTGTITPTSLVTLVTSAQTFTVSGLSTADAIAGISGPSQTSGIGIVAARVSAADTLEITFANVTVGTLTPAAGNYKVIAVKVT